MRATTYLRFSCLGFLIGMFSTFISLDLLAQTTDQANQQASGADNQQSDIAVRSWVERTALFTGDRLTYHIQVQCNENVDILLADLEADELVLTGLELLGSWLDQEQTGEGITYHAVYELTTYETEMPNPGINELRLRYYFKRPGQRIEDVATVGEVIVPAISLALRSTLPTELSELELRDLSSAISVSSWLGSAGTLGLLLIIISIIPLGILISYRLKRPLAGEQDQRQEVLQETYSELEQIKRLDAGDPEQRREGFDHLQKVLKEYIEKVNGITASAFTASELQLKLLESGLGESINELGSLLVECERARYGRQTDLPDAKRLEEGIVLAQSLLSSR